MSEDKNCPHCGAKMVEYKHGLSKGIVRALAKVVLRLDGESVFDIAQCKLTYSERENIRKLQYWDLIQKLPGQEKGGDWLVTDLGINFIKGNVRLSKSVWTYRGDVVRFEGDQIGIEDITDGWKYRPDYAKEAVAHNYE